MSEARQSFYPDDAEIDAFYAGTSHRAGDIFRCRYLPDEDAWRFCLWAPDATSVSVVGDFNDWAPEAHPMGRYRGLWIGVIAEAKQGDNYKFRVEGADGEVVLKADPYALHAETPPGTASKVWEIGGYAWDDAAWIEQRDAADILTEPVAIYELHLGSWRVKDGYEFPSIRELAPELAAYVKDMGFTHVELMPINEFPFDGSWGYQVTGFFAVTSRFGTPQDYQYFVDYLHACGIGVIVDWVPAHFPRDSHGLAHFDGTWLYEPADSLLREHPEWGTYAFDYARYEVVSFLVSSALDLVEHYHIDGIRVDAVSSMLYLDYGRHPGSVTNDEGGNVDAAAVNFIKALNSTLKAAHPGVMTIAEEATSYEGVTRSVDEGGLGFTFKWSMGFMHDTLDFMASDPYFRHGAHDKMTFAMSYAFSEHFILPYSHDEVVHGKASMISKMFGDYLDKFAELKTLYAWLIGHPGKKLMFMGAEFAQFIEWDYHKQLDWFLLDYDTHADMQRWVRALNALYCENRALHANDQDWNGFQWLNVDDRANSVFAFRRTDKTSSVVCVYNFSPQDFAAYDVALPEPGRLTLLLASTEEGVAREVTAQDRELNGLPYRATLVVPKNTALFYDYQIADIAPAPSSGTLDACDRMRPLTSDAD
ncbi:MAG: 1,4-alpha-glucan branching protein GlgB [Actinomycetia bacterium]|nr:1,4-alpha-glucan branching protein GlgB [Actinomycetes bacterium]